jgi:hypothetical protein
MRRDGTLHALLSSVVRYEPPGYAQQAGPDCSAVTVAITGAKTSSWRLRVYADVDGQMAHAGSVRTLTAAGGERVVAFACVPGAKAWEVRGERLAEPQWLGRQQAVPNEQIQVRISAAPVGGPAGVSPIQGLSEPSTIRGYVAGVDGTVVVPGAIVGWSAANANAVNGSVEIDDGSAIIAPANGLVAGASIAETPWGHQFIFTDTTSYFVEYEIAAPGFGA